MEKLRAEIALESQRAAAAEARAAAQEKAALQGKLGAAINAVDTESVSKLLADRIVMRDGKAVVLDESSVEQTNIDGTPTTPQQLYQSWAEAHPWAIKGEVIPGTGSIRSQGPMPPRDPGWAHFVGPNSSARDANILCSTPEGKRRYAEYKRQARAAGAIS